MPSAKEIVEEQVVKTPVVVYSKTYCPYCTETKNLLNELGVKYDVVELDVVANGEELQDAVEDITGQGTVPNTFIGGKSVGGNSKVQKLHKKGELESLLKQAGAL